MKKLELRYLRLQQDQFLIPTTDAEWMQNLYDEVRSRIGPLPLQVKKVPHAYLPFLHTIPRNLEMHNEQVAEESEMFSLLP